jgi:triosephosphate isomerase
MKRKKKLIVAGNWKMNPLSGDAAVKLAADIKKKLGKKKGVADVFIAPPFPFLAPVATRLQRSRIRLAAQDAAAERVGAHTGEVSPAMLKSLGVELVIIGHSERRAAGLTDQAVNARLLCSLKEGHQAILCVGERERDSAGDYFGLIEAQLRIGLHGVSAPQLRRLMIAYEPVWAIGTGIHATAENVQEMKLFIQKVLTDLFGRAAAQKMIILYGGSVTEENAAELLEKGEADGFLVGGASLKSASFAAIIQITDTYGA